MGKQLVTRKNVDDLICIDEKKIYIEKDMILTPGAKDIIRNRGITIVYGKKEEKNKEVLNETDDKEEENLDKDKIEEKITNILVKDFKISNDERVNKVVSDVLEVLNKNNKGE